MSSITRVRTRTSVPTREESLALVRNLLRTAISSIVYLRNIFPEYCFRDRTLTGINIKALMPEMEDAKLLITWLEKGVFDALEKKYLQSIIFGIYTDPDKDTELVESYNFVISYDKNGHSLDVQGSNQDQQFSTPAKITKDEIKQSTLTMMRHLTILSQTLEPLPQDRYLTLKLLYQPNTPENYEPPFFKHANPNDPLRFKLKPTKIKVGTVATPFHHLSLKVKTTGGVSDDAETSTVASSYIAEDDSQPLWENNEEANKEQEKKDLFQLVRSVVLKKKCFTLAALSKEFPHISPSELQVHMKKLKKNGSIPAKSSAQKELDGLIDQLKELLEDEYTVSIGSIRKLMNVGKPVAFALLKQLEKDGVVAKDNQKIKKIIHSEKKKVDGGLGKRKRSDRRSKRVKAKSPSVDEMEDEDAEYADYDEGIDDAPPRKKCSIARDPIVQELCEE